jgi:hypothetical protein
VAARWAVKRRAHHSQKERNPVGIQTGVEAGPEGVDTRRAPMQIGRGMKSKTLRELRDAAPFKPFEIHLSNGHALTVATPDHLFFMPNSGEFLVVLPDGGFRFVDATQVVSAGRGSGRARGR